MGDIAWIIALLKDKFDSSQLGLNEKIGNKSSTESYSIPNLSVGLVLLTMESPPAPLFIYGAYFHFPQEQS